VRTSARIPVRGRRALIEPEPLQQVDRTRVRYRGRTLAYFSGCDYFRLASHPAVLEAARRGLNQLGLNVAASRLTTGNHPIYRRLEQRLMEFFDAADALLVPTGYLGPLVVAQALERAFSHALIDERAHPALQDAARLLDCPVLRFKHRDPGQLAGVVARCGPGARPVVLTDGLFAHDGSVAPLKAYLKCLPADASMIVDDAHGAGVLGKSGKGTLEAEGVGRRRVIQCITLSKAFGAYGGAVLGSPKLRERILTRSQLFVGSTPLPPPLAAAALVAIGVVGRNPRLRWRLAENTRYVRTELRKAGFGLQETPGPILPFYPRTAHDIAALQRRLLAAGVYPPLLLYPGGPAAGYFRFVMSSEHTRAQLDRLINALRTR
jgi:8-amino-7-oxononanoate synthase